MESRTIMSDIELAPVPQRTVDIRSELEPRPVARRETALAQGRPAGPTTRPTDVEYAGWLPIFAHFGNCGAHPQFGHIEVPPDGYRFVKSLKPRPVDSSFFARWIDRAVRYSKVGWSAMSLAARLLGQGISPEYVSEFLTSRCLWSQLALPRNRELVFLTSVPYTYGQYPWVIEIEDVTTLFFPFLLNGQTAETDIRRLPVYKAVKMLLKDPMCRGIITHMRGTAAGIHQLFGDDEISQKVACIPMGVKLPPRWQEHEPSDTIELLFTNSWHQQNVSFRLRGGIDVLHAFRILKRKYPQLRLTLRSSLPPEAEYPEVHRIIKECGVRVIDQFLPREELDQLLRQSHIYLLPAARIHIVSLLQSMAFGLVPVVSDGWGFSEYVDDGSNGLMVRGRYGKVSWQDAVTGFLREDYNSMTAADPAVVEQLVSQVSTLVENESLRRRIGQTARRTVETRYNLGEWNAGLKQAFDRALDHANAPTSPHAPADRAA